MTDVVLLIDGYNVIAPVGPPRIGATGWLARERDTLLDRLAKHLPPPVAHRTCVVFDAKERPIGGTAVFARAGIEVRFAVQHAEADDLIEELIEAHSNARQLTVISSDHRLQAAVRRRGGGFYDSQPWLDRLLAGRLDIVHQPKKMPPVAQPPAGPLPPPPVDDIELPDDSSIDLFLREFGGPS